MGRVLWMAEVERAEYLLPTLLNFELNIVLQLRKFGKSRSIPLASIIVTNVGREKSKAVEAVYLLGRLPRHEVDPYRQDHFRGHLVVHFQLDVFSLA
jgi:hypothetical protein